MINREKLLSGVHFPPKLSFNTHENLQIIYRGTRKYLNLLPSVTDNVFLKSNYHHTKSNYKVRIKLQGSEVLVEYTKEDQNFL